jgi:hypothetical protein
MTRDEWETAEPVATQALRLGEDERRALLETAALGEALRRELLEAIRRSAPASATVSTTISAVPASLDSLQGAASRGGTIAPPAVTLSPGAALDNGRFVIVRPIGRGGMGTVYLAQDTILGTLVALKVLRFDQGLITEARRAAACSDHPHVATIHNVIRTEVQGDPLGVLVMEYVAGTAASRVLDDGPIEVARAVKWARQVAGAIAHAHDRQVLHCDLKPANIMITPEDRAKVLDFGIARATFDPANAAEPLRGTVPYMAPEQLIAREFSPAGDIYGLGVTLFELVSGRRPFAGDGAELRLRILIEPPPRLSTVVPAVPAELDDLVARALAKDPDERFRSARALERALEQVEDGLRVRTATVQLAAPDASPAWRRRAALALAWGAGVLAAVTLLGAFNTATFNLTFGRTGAFAAEPVSRWLEMGLRSLVAPAVYIAAAAIAYLLLALVGRILRRVVPPLHRAIGEERTFWQAVAAACGLKDPVTGLQVLVVLGTVALAVFVIRFRPLIDASLSFISTAPQDVLERLSPANAGEHTAYGQALDLFVLVTLAAVLRIRRWARTANVDLPAGLTAAAFALPLAALLVWELPYRILFWSDFPRVDLAGTHCYRIGAGEGSVLLHCPFATPPRNQIVPAADVRLRPRGVTRSVFAPLSPGADFQEGP